MKIIPQLEPFRQALLDAGLREHFFDSEMDERFYTYEKAVMMFKKRARNSELDDATEGEKKFTEIVSKYLP